MYNNADFLPVCTQTHITRTGDVTIWAISELPCAALAKVEAPRNGGGYIEGLRIS